MKMYGFVHVAESFAVRAFFMLFSCVKQNKPNLLPHILDFPFVLPQQGVIGGIVRGAGKQMVGAVVNLVGFYVIGLPVGVSLMFPVKMGIVGENPVNALMSDNLILFPVNLTNCPFSITVVGLWTGLLISVLTQCIFFAPFLWKLNWKKATEEVSDSTEDIHELHEDCNQFNHYGAIVIFG